MSTEEGSRIENAAEVQEGMQSPQGDGQQAKPADTQQGDGEKKGGCTGNCKNCHPDQRSYCATQICYNTQNLIAMLINRVGELQQDVADLSTAIAALQKREECESVPQEPTLFEPIVATFNPYDGAQTNTRQAPKRNRRAPQRKDCQDS